MLLNLKKANNYWIFNKINFVDIIYPMTLTISEVEHIAELARLELTQQEIQQYRDQLSDILEYAARLQSVDTSKIPPTSSVLPPRSVLRKDKAVQGLTVKDLLSNAPAEEADQFKVPPVFE